ncbi:hypothetical protein [Methylocella sp. CPCC 101449]|uniref:hypothetical protein n=1 Tax=Methylocella sp. CPCC 101449 TaxID=2987531 RepID=UPI0028904380|nr:hypothetical protein [Methylocella sp. CPCC 101449]MDT2022222.1 hypothetical protein [Methylocella sp. CPCC 101449]
MSYILSLNKEHFAFRQKKAEELYLAADRYIKDIYSIYLYYYPYMKGERTYDQVVKDIAELKSAPNTSHPTLQMLTKFYFPEILPALQKLDEERTRMNLLVHPRSGKDYDAFHSAMKALGEASDELLQAIILQGQQFAGLPNPRVLFDAWFRKGIKSKT